MRRLCLYPLIMKGSFLHLHRKDRFGGALRCAGSCEKKNPIEIRARMHEMRGEKTTGHGAPISYCWGVNIYLILNALPHPFFEQLYWISYFLAQHPSYKNSSGFLRCSEIPQKTATNKQKNLERGECEFDKTQGGRFFSNKDHVRECDWNLCVKSVSEGWITHLSWVWELQW